MYVLSTVKCISWKAANDQIQHVTYVWWVHRSYSIGVNERWPDSLLRYIQKFKMPKCAASCVFERDLRGLLFPLLPLFLKLHGSTQWRYIQRSSSIQSPIPCASIASPGFKPKGCEEWTLQRSQTGQAWFDMASQSMQRWCDLGPRRTTLPWNTLSSWCRFYPPSVNAEAGTFGVLDNYLHTQPE